MTSPEIPSDRFVVLSTGQPGIRTTLQIETRRPTRKEIEIAEFGAFTC